MKENEKFFTSEPIIHSHITDVLPKDHPLAYRQVYCDRGCGALVHAANNECMQTWYETEFGNYCTLCFFLNEVLVELSECFIDGTSIRKRCLEAFSHGLKARPAKPKKPSERITEIIRENQNGSIDAIIQYLDEQAETGK